MSMQNAALRTLGDDARDVSASNHESTKCAFHFEIDGHDFIAVEQNAWRGSPDGAIGGETFCRKILGEIVTSFGGYVVLADESPATTEPRVADLLSRRELQVALLIADGRCDKEIARQLTISIYTVREHIRRIFAKLNVCRRGSVIARILKRHD